MNRGELEARLWHHMPRAHPVVIAEILGDVDAYLVAECGRAAARRRVLAGLVDDMPYEFPARLRHANSIASQCRKDGAEIPATVIPLAREYDRLKKRRQRGGAA